MFDLYVGILHYFLYDIAFIYVRHILQGKSMASTHPELRRIAIDRANRLKWLRKQIDKSRRGFALRHKIAASSMQSWEDVDGNGLTENGCLQLVKAFRLDGICVTIPWLMYGLGPEPTKSTMEALTQPIDVPKAYCPNDKRIDEALRQFNKQYANPIDIRMPDNSMEPAYRSGDYMAGTRLYQDDLDKAIGQDCIVQNDQGHIIVRRVEKGTQAGYYRLVAYNPTQLTAEEEAVEQRLFSAAPIVWHYRAFKTKQKA